MHVVSGKKEELPFGLYAEVGRYRHKVFIERLGWELQTYGNIGQDQFDRIDTAYVISRDEHGNISGCARLLPTTQPYLLGEIFPQLLNGLPPPNSPDVWELSRFAAVDFNAKASSALGQFSSHITLQLFHESVLYAAAQGAKRIILVSVVGTERLLKRAGYHAHRAGPPMIINGHPIIACWIEVEKP